MGHGLEADFNRKGTSAFSGRVGQKVASELITVLDDGTMPQKRGTNRVDDEGTPVSKVVLIENVAGIGISFGREPGRPPLEQLRVALEMMGPGDGGLALRTASVG